MGTSHRTIETKVFHFDQLNDKAKEKARDWWRQRESEDPSWANERRQSMEAFCKEFPVELKRWEYDSNGYTLHKLWTAGSAASEIKGNRLYGFILNEYGPRLLWKPKVYTKGGRTRKSKIMVEVTGCPMTGYCMDEALLDPIRKYLKAPNMSWDYRDLMEECFNSWGQACVDDLVYLNSDEQVDEAIIANEYEFDEEGARV